MNILRHGCLFPGSEAELSGSWDEQLLHTSPCRTEAVSPESYIIKGPYLELNRGLKARKCKLTVTVVGVRLLKKLLTNICVEITTVAQSGKVTLTFPQSP